jgi:uncharacterized protein YbaP (TraB family)
VGRKVLGWLLALCLLGSLNAHAGSPVWAIRGEHNTVYLAGSIHLLQASDARLPAAFDRAYSGSKILVMELDLGKLSAQDAASWMKEHGSAPPGTSLRKTLGERRYQRVLSVATRLGLPHAALAQAAPWVLGLELLELQYARMGFDPDHGVEQQLERRAVSDGKPTQGLETLGEQLGAFESLSFKEQAQFLDLVVSETQDLDEETRSVVLAWRSGDAGKLAALLGEEYHSFPRLYKALVTERNKRWLPQIEKLLKANDDYLVVVGALHLVGEGGLLELVARDGYRPVTLN